MGKALAVFGVLLILVILYHGIKSSVSVEVTVKQCNEAHINSALEVVLKDHPDLEAEAYVYRFLVK